MFTMFLLYAIIVPNLSLHLIPYAPPVLHVAHEESTLESQMQANLLQTLHFPSADASYDESFGPNETARRISICNMNSKPSRQIKEPIASLQEVCKHSSLVGLLEFWLSNNFEARYSKVYNKDGWAPEGFVNYFYTDGVIDSSNAYIVQMESWLRSIHFASNRPVVVFVIDELERFNQFTRMWSPDKFSNLLLLNMRGYPVGSVLKKKGMHTHNFRAALFARLRRGIMMDSDELLLPVHGQIDLLFNRIAQESTDDYPYPILQVHWMSKDPRSNPHERYYHMYDWHCDSELCIEQKARWCQGNVMTFSSAAHPFISTAFFNYVMDVGPPEMTKTSMNEPTINMELWKHNATKQWCRFDIPFPMMPNNETTDEELVTSLRKDVSRSLSLADSYWYPNGVPRAMVSLHHVQSSGQADRYASLHHNASWSTSFQQPGMWTWYFMGQVYKSGKELQKAHPEIPCLLV